MKHDEPVSTTPPLDPAAGTPQRGAEWRARRELYREAALQAERATGRHERTDEQARRNVFLRIGTVVAGFAVLLAGVAMMVLPGPGVVAILAGLAILSRELPWAERLLEYVKKRAKIDELEEQPTWVKGLMWAITIGAVAGSIAYIVLT